MQNSTRKHTKREEKVKPDKEAYQNARQNVKPRLLLETKHVVDEILRHSPWIFSPLKIFHGGQIGVDERTKILDCDGIMKAFFAERKNLAQVVYASRVVRLAGHKQRKMDDYVYSFLLFVSAQSAIGFTIKLNSISKVAYSFSTLNSNE